MINKGEPKTKNAGPAAIDALEPDGSPVFLLEDLYPDATTLFSAAVVPSADNVDSLVAFDTNALLLPYNIASQDLSAFAKVLSDLANTDRLFVPGRAAREFIKHRDRKLADMLKALRDKTSSVRLPEKKLSPLLDGVDGYTDVTAAAETLSAAWRDYKKAQEKILSTMREWRGNDPVSLVYNQLLVNGRIVEIDDDRDALIKEWDVRRAAKRPPGYKDSGKDDTGIGDFLIWKTLLKLGSAHKKDLIFITGDDKADWFVRSDSERVYPRPELVDEYRRASGGKSIRLSSLSELLEEMQAPTALVDEVKAVEQQANDWAERSARAAHVSSGPATSAGVLQRLNSSADLCTFDYSTYDGRVSLESGGAAIDLRFNKRDRGSIYLSGEGSTTRIARIKDLKKGTAINLDDHDTTSGTYTIHTNETFVVENDEGDTLVGWLMAVQDDTRGDAKDGVKFAFKIFKNGEIPVVL